MVFCFFFLCISFSFSLFPIHLLLLLPSGACLSCQELGGAVTTVSAMQRIDEEDGLASECENMPQPEQQQQDSFTIV